MYENFDLNMSLIECVYAKDEIEKKKREKKKRKRHTGKISRVL
jgi:hypothetical protein